VSDRQQRIQRRGTRRRAPVDLTDLRSTFDAVTFIYALIDPRDGVVRYVGQAVNPHRRLSGHLSRARTNPTSRAHRWLNELLAAGLRSQLEILQEVVDARSMADRAVMGAARSRLARGSKAAATRASAGGAGHQNVLGRLGRYAIGCTDAVQPATDTAGQVLMYDTEMQRVHPEATGNQPCLSAARHLPWPPAHDWEFAEDPLTLPYLYDASYDAFADSDDLLQDEDEDLDGEEAGAPPG
jgi:hypothetical protein